ncbi:MAG: histidine phosphatase family protein [Candidatus Dormibacteria bacterium]
MPESERSSNFLKALDALHERFLVGVEGVTEVWLVRHGDAYAELVSIDDSKIDPPLSPRGRREAEQLGERLSRSGIDLFWASSLLRAQETAALAAAGTGLQVRTDNRLREVRTHWDGGEELPTEADPPSTRYIPFVEDFQEVVERMEGAVREIAEGVGPGGGPVAVSHAGAISMYLSHLLGLDFGQLKMLVMFTSVSVLRIKGDRVVVQSIGDLGHLLREGVPAAERG